MIPAPGWSAFRPPTLADLSQRGSLAIGQAESRLEVAFSTFDAPEARPIEPETVGGAGVEVLKQGDPASYGRRMFGALGPSCSMTSPAAMHGLVAGGPGKKAGSTPLESVEVCASRAWAEFKHGEYARSKQQKSSLERLRRAQLHRQQRRKLQRPGLAIVNGRGHRGRQRKSLCGRAPGSGPGARTGIRLWCKLRTTGSSVRFHLAGELR
jgi:hypothetical protein